MSRPVKEKSANVIALEKHKEMLDKAKELNTKTPNAANKTALDKMQAAYDLSNDAVKRDRFLNLTAGRAGKVLDNCANLTRAFDPKLYKYSAAEASEIADAIFTAAENLRKHVATVLENKPAAAKAERRFSFEK